MRTVFSKIPYLMEKNIDLMLVTIVEQAGSSPRGNGSQMLVCPEGQLCGTIGGGSVEKTAEQYAIKLIAEKKSELHLYELRKGVNEDIGMECGGDVKVLFQYIDSSDARWLELARQITTRIADKQAGWLVLHLDGSMPSLENERPEGDGIFAMSLAIGERVLLCGGGHVAKALAPVLASVGFRIWVMDIREEFVTEERFPMAERRIVGDYSKLNDYIDISEDDYVVVMTNGHAHDFDVEEQVLRTETAYVGVIGSAKKTASVNERLRAAGIDEETISGVHTPIGLNIKAVTPEEIAISITAEMVLVRAERRDSGEESKACPMQ
ncbi:MAG: xanthine dehydrogenase accessory protein XdhC [Clostridiales bacterium]|nr:xanthine dehydrogenase accessory protein XdhC [Candidatus Crickella equi]